jgi:hypothetical protein
MKKRKGFTERQLYGVKVQTVTKLDLLMMGATEEQADKAMEDLETHAYFINENDFLSINTQNKE